MLSRRTALGSALAATLATRFAGFAAAQDGAFRFGIVADPQYAPVPPNLASGRYYANSLWKMQEAVAELNRHDLKFVATLGDIIDRHWESFGHVLPVYDGLKHPKVFVLGNHDYEVGREFLRSVVRTVGMPNAYYDFAGGGYRFVVIDGNDVSTFAPPVGDPRRELAAERLARLKASGAPNAQSWNGSLSDEQFAWLQRTLDAARTARENVVVLGHYPVFPADKHNMWDSQRIVDLLTSYDNFVAYLCGHNHAGNYGEIGGRHFINFRGMVDTPTTTAYSIVEMHPDRLRIEGFGREESRSYAIRARA
ncbi:metallophosphoesterase [Enterovirga aerilata]|uniref:Phosphatase n=1 Tax=Enterovirga aerilata TaxID=2730920 RepID=A0A849HUV1_9HYPH|nr:metallophosphoesterase [Enterovirga sp. DB1703]NNM71266.1 phosphatase [Enterovirga sp. DB1703]